MQDFEDQLRQWRSLEHEALHAEERIKGVQGANSPEFAQLARDAADKRRTADEFLDRILGITKGRP